MSDDLNQAIEHVNEVAKNQSTDDPVCFNNCYNSLPYVLQSLKDLRY